MQFEIQSMFAVFARVDIPPIPDINYSNCNCIVTNKLLAF